MMIRWQKQLKISKESSNFLCEEWMEWNTVSYRTLNIYYSFVRTQSADSLLSAEN